MVCPKKSHLVVLNCSFFGLNLIPFIRAVLRNWSRFTSWSLESTPLVRMSSMHPVIPFTSLRTAFNLSRNASALTLRPKGSRSHLYFPHGVLKVVRSELSLSNSTIQYPEAASPSVKYFPLWSSALTSSIVFEQYWFLLMLLLRSFGSRHSRIDLSGLETGTTPLIQSVCPWTGQAELSSSSLYAAFFFSGTARGGCCTGCASGLSWIWYLPPGSFPIPSNESQNSDNTYSFAMGKLWLFPFTMTASSNTSHVGLLT